MFLNHRVDFRRQFFSMFGKIRRAERLLTTIAHGNTSGFSTRSTGCSRRSRAHVADPVVTLVRVFAVNRCLPLLKCRRKLKRWYSNSISRIDWRLERSLLYKYERVNSDQYIEWGDEPSSYWSMIDQRKKPLHWTKNKDGGVVTFIRSLFPKEESSLSVKCCAVSWVYHGLRFPRSFTWFLSLLFRSIDRHLLNNSAQFSHSRRTNLASFKRHAWPLGTYSWIDQSRVWNVKMNYSMLSNRRISRRCNVFSPNVDRERAVSERATKCPIFPRQRSFRYSFTEEDQSQFSRR